MCTARMSGISLFGMIACRIHLRRRGRFGSRNDVVVRNEDHGHLLSHWASARPFSKAVSYDARHMNQARLCLYEGAAKVMKLHASAKLFLSFKK